MIDYAKHIDVLIDLRTYHSAPTREHQETLTAMIELMRAAAARAEACISDTAMDEVVRLRKAIEASK